MKRKKKFKYQEIDPFLLEWATEKGKLAQKWAKKKFKKDKRGRK